MIEWIERPGWGEDLHPIADENFDSLRCGLRVECGRDAGQLIGAYLRADEDSVDRPVYAAFALLSDEVVKDAEPVPVCEDCYDWLVGFGMPDVRP